ncbi:MAG TPA: response regulator transcription factor [Pyrinomonadaceae bacterium]|nr:response regulator transcription factor [Pyrinomonadaceae bacterium]
MKILIVEDEHHIADGLRFNLEAEGYDVSVAGDGETALKNLGEAKFDAVVLDVMLPGINGFRVARSMRDRADYTPILMLTARGRPEDVLMGFESGTDDYLPKPFDLEIFIARIKALLRRGAWARRPEPPVEQNETAVINGRSIDFENLELTSSDGTIHLTLMEMKLLRFLIDNAGRAVSRKTILEEVWDLQEDTDTRAIDNFIVRLRKYLEDEPNNPKILRTVRGVGYKYVPEEA